jgi:hypothetical protein
MTEFEALVVFAMCLGVLLIGTMAFIAHLERKIDRIAQDLQCIAKILSGKQDTQTNPQDIEDG